MAKFIDTEKYVPIRATEIILPPLVAPAAKEMILPPAVALSATETGDIATGATIEYIARCSIDRPLPGSYAHACTI